MIDEMSMMINIVLCGIEQCLNQSFQNNTSLFYYILVLLV
jgi:hypothetical protein